ncbi:MAG TPA: GDSL-type esterase/lipase family protein [Actinocrinis sp.]|nr:GDSL-type esterase/lipase family protein [Actinocrinis sp.]
MNDPTRDFATATAPAQPQHRAPAFQVTDFAAGPVLSRGLLELERTRAGWLPRRLPAWTRPQHPEQGVEDMAVQPSGVRLAFCTSADSIELDVLTTQALWPGDTISGGVGGFDLVVDGAVRAAGATQVLGDLEVRDTSGAIVERRPGQVGTVRFDALGDAAKQIELWLPHHTRVDLVELRADAAILPPAAAGRSEPRWVHHGSSISHCHAAERPTEIWPAIAARRAGVEVVNLGLGGHAQLDPFTARAIRDLPADLISLKIGINIVNADSFRLRAFIPAVHGFLDTIREGHPDTPLLVISPIICPPVEDRPGPTVADPQRSDLWFISHSDPAETALGRLSLGLIRETLAQVVEERSSQDPNLHYLDGRRLFDAEDLADLPDNLHPNAAGYRRMGERFADLVFAEGGVFAQHVDALRTS